MATILYPLASLSQIEKSPSKEDGLPGDIEEDLRVFGCKLIHQAGILLKQQWFLAGSRRRLRLRKYSFNDSDCHCFTIETYFFTKDIGMGALYLSSKLEESPLRMRDIINVYDLLLQKAAHSISAKAGQPFQYRPMSYFGGTFYQLKDALVVAEMQILKRLGFNVHVTLPYNTLINYLRLLGLGQNSEVCTKAWGYLNDALQTIVHAVYQIPTIVCAAILLATRHLKISLPSEPPACWWSLFDADWEDIWSVCGYIMRLYRPRRVEEERRILGMLTKHSVRQWVDDQGVMRERVG